MSKQSEAKAAQGYNPKPIPPQCVNCKHYSSLITKEKGYLGGEYRREKEIKCSLGGFAVKKQGTCNFHTFLNGDRNVSGKI